MSASADNLRSVSEAMRKQGGWHIHWHGYLFTAADILDAIEALHQPCECETCAYELKEHGVPPECVSCNSTWPCATAVAGGWGNPT